jgi:hypothetical protein
MMMRAGPDPSLLPPSAFSGAPAGHGAAPVRTFRIGQRVRMVRVADDLTCKHLGQLGVIE